MDAMWDLAGWLVCLAVLYLTAFGIVLASSVYVSSRWGRSWREVLAVEMVRRGWVDGLDQSASRRRWEEHYFPESFQLGVDETEDVDLIRSALVFGGKAGSREEIAAVLEERATRRDEAALRLAEWARKVDDVDVLLRWYGKRAAIEGAMMRWSGIRVLGIPAAKRVLKDAAKAGGYVAIAATVFAMICWAGLGIFQGRSDRTDWVAYVGWWTAVASCVGVLVSLLREFKNIRDLLFIRTPKRSTSLLALASICIFVVPSLHFFGVVESWQAWFLNEARELPDWVSSILGIMVCDAYLGWLGWRAYRMHANSFDSHLERLARLVFIIAFSLSLTMFGTTQAGLSVPVEVAPYAFGIPIILAMLALAGVGWWRSWEVTRRERKFLSQWDVEVPRQGFSPRFCVLCAWYLLAGPLLAGLVSNGTSTGGSLLAACSWMWLAAFAGVTVQSYLYRRWRTRLRTEFERSLRAAGGAPA